MTNQRARNLLGARVTGRYRDGSIAAIGTAVALIEHPALIIRTDTGRDIVINTPDVHPRVTLVTRMPGSTPHAGTIISDAPDDRALVLWDDGAKSTVRRQFLRPEPQPTPALAADHRKDEPYDCD